MSVLSMIATRRLVLTLLLCKSDTQVVVKKWMRIRVFVVLLFAKHTVHSQLEDD